MMRNTRILAVLAMLAVGSWVSANQLANGGFEVPALNPDSFVNFASGTEPAGEIWTVTNGNVDIGRLPLTSFGINFNAYEGNQVLDLNGVAPGRIRQSFTTTAGVTYRLTFAYADNPLDTGTSSASVDVVDATDASTVAGIFGTSISHSTSTSTIADWLLFDQTFVATGTTSQLIFMSTSADTSSSGGIFLDAVDVSVVPEPANLALAIPIFASLLTIARPKR